jgi:N-methylhydantoinase B/oxoprolinase/acetone carboxylase alpha subunit
MLVSFSQQQGLPEVGTVATADQMDDGTPIRLAVTIDRRDGSALFDFEGGRGGCEGVPAQPLPVPSPSQWGPPGRGLEQPEE